MALVISLRLDGQTPQSGELRGGRVGTMARDHQTSTCPVVKGASPWCRGFDLAQISRACERRK